MGCTNVFFQPSRQLFVDPTSLKPSPEPVKFTSRDGTVLWGWGFKAPGKTERPLIVQFHGNAENMTSHFRSLFWLVEQGFDLFVFDYRGYGASEGKVEATAIVEDGEAALAKAAEMVGNRPKSIIVYGQSLGGNVALSAVSRLQARDTLRAVVVESTFWSYPEIASDALASFWLTWPLQWMGCLLVSGAAEPRDSLAQIADLPFLVIHGDADTIVPLRHGEKVWRRLPAPKCFWQVPGGGHINSMQVDNKRWRAPLTEFLQTGHCSDRAE